MAKKCPYCRARLEQTPKRKKNCPNCGKPIFVRKGRLLTEDDAKIEEWLTYLAQFDITRRSFNKHRQRLSKQFGFLAPVNDTVWRILNLQVSRAQSFHAIQMAYREMARLASREGKDPKPYTTEALRTQLNELKSRGTKTVVIVNVGRRGDEPHTCQKCRALYSKSMNIDTALATMPVPTVCESETGCRCSYIAEGAAFDNTSTQNQKEK